MVTAWLKTQSGFSSYHDHIHRDQDHDHDHFHGDQDHDHADRDVGHGDHDGDDDHDDHEFRQLYSQVREHWPKVAVFVIFIKTFFKIFFREILQANVLEFQNVKRSKYLFLSETFVFV